MFAVPLKSLKRWIKVGPERKKGMYSHYFMKNFDKKNLGGGRKIRDPEMEQELFNWYLNLKNKDVPITPKMVKQKALSVTKYKDFIASKGWLEKFKRKYKLELSREKDKKKKHDSNIVFNTKKTTPQERKRELEEAKKLEK